MARLVVESLLRKGILGKLVAHRIPLSFPKRKAIVLPSSRWVRCLGAIMQWSRQKSRGTQFLNLNYVLLAPWLRILKPECRILARPGNTISAELNFLRFWKRPFVWSAYQMAFFCSDTVIAQSRTMAKDLHQTFVGINHKIQILPNPVAPAGPSEVKMQSHRGIPAEPFIFCAMSFKPQKDFLTLFRSFKLFAGSLKSVPPLLIVAGRFQNRELQALAKRESSPYECHVRLVGEIADPDNWIKRSRFCVLTSHYEGNSNFLLEAVYHGKQIVTTDCPGANKEMAALYPNVLLCPPQDSNALARQMKTLFKKSVSYQYKPKNNLKVFEQSLIKILQKNI